jgi:hypothetical protein
MPCHDAYLQFILNEGKFFQCWTQLISKIYHLDFYNFKVYKVDGRCRNASVHTELFTKSHKALLEKGQVALSSKSYTLLDPSTARVF